MRFILVDEILDLDPGQSIRARKRLSADEELFRDHFPGFAVVPGVLLTEMMGQAAGKCLEAEGRERGKAMLAQIRSASFRKWVLPEQEAILIAEIQSNRPSVATAKCRVEVDSQTVAQADLLFTFVSYSEFSPGYRDEVLQRYMEKEKKREAT